MALNRAYEVRCVELDLVRTAALNDDAKLRALLEGLPILDECSQLPVDRVAAKAILKLEDEPPLQRSNEVVVNISLPSS